MIKKASADGASWRLFYCARSRESMAYREELSQYGDQAVFAASADSERLDVAEIIDSSHANSLIYCCGPERLIAEAALHMRPGKILHAERFHNELEPGTATGFTVELGRSGLIHEVPAATSLLDVLLDAGADILTSCEEGTCGTCEVRVLAGTPDHRDVVLTEEQKASGECMMVCVSRSKTPRLVLDL